ncbi:hypothetical protein JCM11251_005125 [Rhodosporidiobolus azoricus]
MTSSIASASLQDFLSRAVNRNDAPGLVACAFDRTSTFASAASGVSSIDSERGSMTPATLLWLASKSKTLISLAVLKLEADAAKAGNSVDMGALHGYNIPRVCEAGERYHYGCQGGYLALFIIRLHGKSLRRSLWDLVLSPLNVKPSTLDIYFPPPELASPSAAQVAFRSDVGSFVPPPFEFEVPMFEDEAPEGQVPLADGAFFGTLPVFADVLRHFLLGETPLSDKMWKEATKDDLASRGLGVPQKPAFKSSLAPLAADVDVWAKTKEDDKVEKDDSLGWSLMQTLVHRYETKDGHQPGTLEWAGLANTYFFIDPSSGLGGIISAQFVPFAVKEMLDLKHKFFRWVRDNAPTAAKV